MNVYNLWENVRVKIVARQVYEVRCIFEIVAHSNMSRAKMIAHTATLHLTSQYSKGYPSEDFILPVS